MGYGLFTKPVRGTSKRNKNNENENSKGLNKQASTSAISAISTPSNDSETTLSMMTMSSANLSSNNNIDYYSNPKVYIGYFRDPWNILDFIIVLSSFSIFLPQDGNYTTIRVLRILRPLRSVSRIKELKALVTTIILSLQYLVNVSLLLLFLFAVYAIIGMQLYQGLLHHQCFSDHFTEFNDIIRNNESYWVQDTYFCKTEQNEMATNNTKLNGCPNEYPWCLSIAPNPDGGVTNFDDFFSAILQVFVAVTLEGWVNIMYHIQNAGEKTSWIYFVSLTFIAGFFAINLCLAVIEDVYSDQMNPKRVAKLQRRKSKKKHVDINEKANQKMIKAFSEERGKTLADINMKKTVSFDKNLNLSFVSASELINKERANSYHSRQQSWSTKKKIVSPLGRGSKSWLHTWRTGGLNTENVIDRERARSLNDNDNDSKNNKRNLTSRSDNAGYNSDNVAYKMRNNTNHRPIIASMDDIYMPDSKPFHRSNRSASLLLTKQPSTLMKSISDNDGNAIFNDIFDDNNNNVINNSDINGMTGHDINDIYEDDHERVEAALKARKEHEKFARKAIEKAKIKPLYNEWIKDKGWFVLLLNDISISSWFQGFIMFLILINTVILAIEYPGMSLKLREGLETCNVILTTLFFVEMLIKMGGLGMKAYFKDKWNDFDFIIVVVSSIELIVKLSVHTGKAKSGLGAFRALRLMRLLRLLRVFRLLGKFDTLRRLLNMVLESIDEVGMLTAILAIFIFMFATLAMSLFGEAFNKYFIIDGNEANGRWKFDDFYWSMVTVFQVITGDAWNEVMYDTVIATNTQVTCIYFIIVIAFGTFLILNLFVAILLSNIDSENYSLKQREQDMVSYSKEMFNSGIMDEEEQVARIVMKTERDFYLKEYKKNLTKWKHSRKKNKMEGKSLGIFSINNWFRIFCHKLINQRFFEPTIDVLIIINCILLALDEPHTKIDSKVFKYSDIIFTILFVAEMLIKIIALGCFPQPFRVKRTWLSLIDNETLTFWTEQSYEAIVYMHQINNKIRDVPGLAIECKKSSPDGYYIVHLWGAQDLRIVFRKPNSNNNSYRFFTCYILIDNDKGKWQVWDERYKPDLDDEQELENVLKSFDLSDYYHNAYLASNWNRLDAFVVIIAVLGVGLQQVSFLKALRAFRPFRIMVRVRQIKVVLGALVRAIPAMTNTIIFCTLFWFVLAVLGVGWLSDKYSFCVISDESLYNGGNDEEWVKYNINRMDCQSINGLSWENSIFNFDHIFQALHTLFVAATLSGWNDIMYVAIDSPLIPGEHPTFEHEKYYALYFIAIVVLCSFFSLNLIVSVVVDNFNSIKREKDEVGLLFMTDEQKLWANNRILLSKISLKPMINKPKLKIREYCYKLVSYQYFEPFILSCIIINAFIMGFETYGQNQAKEKWLRTFDVIFVIIFALEAVLKIIGYTFSIYIYHNWNKFDFVISIIGVIGLGFRRGLGLNVVRLFRVARVLRLIHKAKKLKMLFSTLIYSAPSLWNIGLLLFVTFFIYAVIGMNLFGDLQHELIDEVNFNTFGNSLLLLYRIGSEDGWTDVYESYLSAYQSENERIKVYIFFMTFFMFGTLVLINLFIAVVLDSFDENNKSDDNLIQLEPVEHWRNIWEWYDPNAKGILDVNIFINTLLLSPKPIGLNTTSPFISLYNNYQKLKKTKSMKSRRKFNFKLKSINTFTNNNNSNSNRNEFKDDSELSRQMSNSTSRSFSSRKYSLRRKQLIKKWKEYEFHDYYTAQTYANKLASTYDHDTRIKELNTLCNTHKTDEHHKQMLKLLVDLKLKVKKKKLTNETKCQKIWKFLLYIICGKNENNMDNMTTPSNNNSTPSKSLNSNHSNSIYDMIDVHAYQIEYHKALMQVSAVILKQNIPEIELKSDELLIQEWYAEYYQCQHIYNEIKKEIAQSKMKGKYVPSRHINVIQQQNIRNNALRKFNEIKTLNNNSQQPIKLDLFTLSNNKSPKSNNNNKIRKNINNDTKKKLKNLDLIDISNDNDFVFLNDHE